MRVALLTDTHFGVRNDSLMFHNYMREFYTNVFFPYLKENNIKRIVHLGDTFDRRKYMNFNSFALCCEYFFEPLKAMGIEVDMLVGNHDTFYKNTNKINSPELLIAEKYPNIRIYSEPAEIDIGGMSTFMLPWINAENKTDCFDMIKKSEARIVMSHLELSGFEMYKGQHSFHGMATTGFDNFEQVLSGHYHTRSTKGNIRYLGAPYEMTWGDYNDTRGFHVIDTETLEIEAIDNPYKMFHKLVYDDTDIETYNDLIETIDFDQYKDKYLKVIIRSKNNAFWFDQVIDNITGTGVHHLQVVEDHMYMDIEDDVDISAAEDTLTILRKYVEQLEIKKQDKKNVNKLLTELYSDALTMI